MEDGESDAIDLSDIRRRLWVIILLTLLAGPFSFVYCGQLSRAIRWQLGLWLFGLLPLAGMLYTPFVKMAFGALVIGGIATYLAIIVLAWKAKQVLPWKPYQKWWGYLMLLIAFQVAAYGLTTAVRDYWCESFFIPANSMNDTIIAGDRIIVEKIMFRLDESKRQSIVVFRIPDDESQSVPTNYVKRLIAMAGDRIAIKDDQVFVNGQPIEEPYVKHEGELDFRYRDKLQQFPEQVVPKGQAFVLGDNRWQSRDSRMFGFVPYVNFIGEGKCIFWSREYHFVPPSRDARRDQKSGAKYVGTA